MPEINIPGVTDKYNTNGTVEKLMQIERIPLEREQKTLETYKKQQDAWRDINRKMASLRDNIKTLYSFDNPFNNKLASSTQENAITATATRSATYDSYKIDVVQKAEADRFLSDELSSDIKVPQGTYTYKVGDKSVTMRWKGGGLKEFSDSLNRRGNKVINSKLITSSQGKKTLSIESLITGEENKLELQDDALSFALSTGTLLKNTPRKTELGTSISELKTPKPQSLEQKKMPQITLQDVKVSSKGISVPPRGGFELPIPPSVVKEGNNTITFNITEKETEDITEKLNRLSMKPQFPQSGSITFKDVTIFNIPVDTALPENPTNEEPVMLEPIKSDTVLYVKYANGTESPLPLPDTKEGKVTIKLDEGEKISSIVIRNANTASAFNIENIEASNSHERAGYTPKHAISQAQNAVLKYEGITIKRPGNLIDDIIPEVTLNIEDTTEKTATINIKPDTESAKNALISFVGQYNQAMGELNVLIQNKPEIIEEMDYLTDSERDKLKEKMGMFSTDSSLSSLKANLQNIAVSHYPSQEEAKITMLSQIGISTNAGSYSGYTPTKLRGYLEIDEKKLDAELKTNLDDVKNLFGYDSDGDLIIDTGIGVRMDKQLTAYVQTGGIFAMKTTSLDARIKSSENKISTLENQMDKKEAELRYKYGQMQGTLNSLENQSNSISNFSKQNQRN